MVKNSHKKNCAFVVINDKVFFDYVGTMYPSGLASEQLCYFNEENIDKVVFEGFKDEEEALAKQEGLKKGDVSITPDEPTVREH
jgi:hypothetical protein